MTPRRLPFVFLAVLALLTAGFAVLGVIEGPSIADLSVTNATSATYGSPLGATSFTLDVVERAPGGQVEARQVRYQRSGHLAVYALGPTTQRLGTLGPDDVAEVLGSYAAVTAGSTHWAQRGDVFRRTETLASYQARVPGGPRPTAGLVHEIAVVRQGYLIAFSLQVTNPAGVDEIFEVVRINGRATHPPAL